MRFKKIGRSVFPKGEEEALKKVPRESGRWAQIPAGPVVPAKRAILPPYAKMPTNGMLQKNPQGR